MSASQMRRLEEALAAYATWTQAGSQDREAFLAGHADLRDLLETLLDERAEASPRTLGNFELGREIGRGGMGVVYEAVDVTLHRRVALKVLPAHLTLRPSSIARFQREATIAARLQHEGIVKVHSVGSAEGAHFFAMDLVDGVPLDRIDSSPADEQHVARVAGLAAQVAEALAHAHAQGVLHRDVKPSNILVRADGRALLTDFGLAREEDLPGLTLTGENAGTPHYVSPEQARGTLASVDARSDVFSLGATLYELLTGVRAFDGASSAEILAKIAGQDPVDPSVLNPRLPPDLVAITCKALEKEPRARYQTARELADDLRAFLAYRPVQARRASRFTRLLRLARREPVKAALLATLVLGTPLVAGLAGYLLANRSNIDAGVLARRTTEVERLLGEAFVYLLWNETARAQPLFEEALASDAECAEAVYGLARLRKARQEPGEALALLDRHAALVEREPALAQLRAAVLAISTAGDTTRPAPAAEPEPTTALEFFGRGMDALPHRGNDAAAGRRALAAFTAAGLHSKLPRLVYHAMRACAANEAGEVDEARVTADALERLWPDSWATWYYIGMATAGSDPQRSAAAFERAAQGHPAPAFVWTNLASQILNTGQARRALQVAKQAADLDPRLAPAHHVMGHALLALARHDAGIRELETAVALDPAHGPAWCALVDALDRHADRARVMERLSAALAAVPRHEARARAWLEERQRALTKDR